MKKLIIVRHGNTFTADQIPTRVGRNTDIPLVEEQLGKRIGQYLSENNIKLNHVYAAPLQRTLKTAQLIINELSEKLTIEPLADFSEIDYGPDENQIEDEVIRRLGKKYLNIKNVLNPTNEQIAKEGNDIIKKWNDQAIVPYDWNVDIEKIILSWKHFANSIAENETALLVSSNGIIRFAPHLLSDNLYNNFIQVESLKVRTGSLSIFENNDKEWECRLWNKRP